MLDFEYILVFIIIGIVLSGIILFTSYLIALQKGDMEKISPYECGFNPFEDARQEFDVKFYLVAILFIIFDLEIAFLFPWAVTLSSIGIEGYISMIIFLLLLTIGFIYEWKRGALEW